MDTIEMLVIRLKPSICGQLIRIECASHVPYAPSVNLEPSFVIRVSERSMSHAVFHCFPLPLLPTVTGSAGRRPALFSTVTLSGFKEPTLSTAVEAPTNARALFPLSLM